MIRKFESSDLDKVLDIWFKGNVQAHHFVPASYWKKHIGYVSAVLPESEVYVYLENGEVVAFVGLEGDYIAGLFVESGYRSKGIGHEIMEFLKKIHDVLTLSVYEKNKRAVGFYKKEKFCIVEAKCEQSTHEKEFVMKWQKEDVPALSL